MPQWVIDKIKSNKWYMVAAFVILVPIFAYQNMKTRMSTVTYDLDEKVPGLKLVMLPTGAEIAYQDGKRLPIDGLGVAPMTWDDNAKAPERLKEAGYTAKDNDFPVVVFFNSTGFDSTGRPVMVRKAKNGESVWMDVPFYAKVHVVVPNREGGFSAYLAGETKATIVNDEDWYTKYMGVDLPLSAIPPEKLDKMTDDELKLLGIQRTLKEPVIGDAKAGVRGTVIRTGGIPAVQPLSVPVYVFRGDLGEITERNTGVWNADTRLVGKLVSGADGRYSLPLQPGEYTLAAEEGGKLFGNALNQKKWPTVKVKKDAWTEYDFRRSN